MNFTVIREHREFFKKHHWIECDGVVSAAELKRFASEIPLVLAERKKKSSLMQEVDNNAFTMGYDLWRESQPLKKIILSRSLAQIASELLEEKPLRFGYDCLFPAVEKETKNSPYEIFLHTHPTLHEMSCIQGVLCGAMLCLSGESQSVENEPTTIFCKTPGNAVFFAPDWPLPLQEIYHRPGFTYLLIVYAKSNGVYYSQTGDPHLHNFKRLGYNFGDRLKEPFHPIVWV